MMKHRLLVMGSVLILNLGLGGCTWDSSLYETYARNDSVTRCPPGNLLTDAEGEKYIDLSTVECYKGKIKFKSGGGNTYSLLKNETDGEDAIEKCVDAEQNCKAGVADAEQNCKDNAADCKNCSAWIEDYRMCMAFQDFEDLFEKDNNTMPSIDFIADDRPTKNLRYHYAEAGKYRICPNDYNTCYYHKPNALERGQFGCVSDCPLSMIDPNTGKCQFLCNQNTCRIGNKCENQDQACGRDCVNCTTKSDDQVASYRCNKKYGACTAQECQPGYHLKAVGDDQFACEANKDYLCGTVNSQETFDCSEATHDPDASNYRCNAHGACTVKTCQRGYHLKVVENDQDDQYACEANADDLCGPVDKVSVNCSAATHDANASIYRCNKHGACTVKVCNNGFHLKATGDDQFECEANTDALCGAMDAVETSDCSKATHDANASIYRCNDYGVCTVKVCNTRYHLKKSEDADDQYSCEKNGPKACGAVDSVDIYSCYNVNNSASSRNCNNEGLCDCINSNYIAKRGDDGAPYCVQKLECDDVACHEQEGWLTGECKPQYENKWHDYCHTTTCQKGYHQKKNEMYMDLWVAECERNTDEACGLATMTYDSQFDNYPVNCEKQNAKCDNDYGLCYDSDKEQYWCQDRAYSPFDWRKLSDCYFVNKL